MAKSNLVTKVGLKLARTRLKHCDVTREPRFDPGFYSGLRIQNGGKVKKKKEKEEEERKLAFQKLTSLYHTAL